jgi:myo-inositol-1(or 4)-monophosphatase
VAAGRLDGFWEIGLQPWDIAAGALLVQEAGGLISDFDGGSDWMDNGRIVAANPKCLKAMLQVIRPALGSAAEPPAS